MANTFVQIGTTITVGSGGAADAVFSSIPATFTDLKLVVSVRSNRTLTNDYLKIAFNGSSANYTSRSLVGSGTAASSQTESAAASYISDINADNSTASVFSNLDIYIPNYAGSTNKSISVDSVMENNATTAYATLTAGLWAQTAAITSLGFSLGIGTLILEYSSFSLYGIKST
jgi:hypothetical protein